MSSMRFLCQHCHQPLKSRQTLDTLSLVPGGPGATQEDGGNSKELAASQGAQASASSSPSEPNSSKSQERVKSFTLLGDCISVKTLDSIQKTCAYIFDALSDLEGVDHPLCEECTHCLLEQLDTQLASAQRDCQTYQRCLEFGGPRSGDESSTLEAQLQDLMAEEDRLVQELEHLGRSQAEVAAHLSSAQAKTAELVQQKKQHLKDFRASQWQQQELLDELSSLDNRLMYAQHQIRQLRTTDIFNATFEISEDGPVGVINSFRLGRLPRIPVGWNEINAAWGQAALLLLALSNAVGLQFQRYHLVACGSRSYLKSRIGEGEELPLASDGRQNVFLNNKFDRAMLAFLDCLQQFQQAARRGGLCVPYEVHTKEGFLGDPADPEGYCSVRTHLNTEEQWTTALRRMLSNLKFCMEWVSERYRPK
ncbi:beclin-2-like [Octodon degus]|uniref:Beclin-2-like n=1 Tax=Octodon degus TaxID=10160 RepID=A0A6P3EJC7_OCTDE|nr:beclin-2-like [Octodon degus]